MKHAPNNKKPSLAAASETKKATTKILAKTVKPAVKKATVSAPKTKAKKASTVSSAKPQAAKKSKSTAPKKPSEISAARPSRLATKKTKPVVSAVKTRTNSVKVKSVDAPKKVKPAKSQAAAKVVKPKTVAPKKPIATVKKTAKNVPRVSPRTNKSAKPKARASVGKTKAVKPQNVAAVKKSKTAKSKIAIEKNKPSKVSASIPAKKNSGKNAKVKTALPAKIGKAKTAQTVVKKVQEPKFSKVVKVKNKKPKTNVSLKKIRAVGNKNQPKIEKSARRVHKSATAKAVENKIEIVKPSTPQKPKKRKAKAIGSAVFRGRRERYDFQVFPLDSEFDKAATPAIYVISKRKTDRNRRAHHALVCIGQTDSISGEIKRHAKSCIKKHSANVISILPEASERKRLKIEADLKAAHSFACGVG